MVMMMVHLSLVLLLLSLVASEDPGTAGQTWIDPVFFTVDCRRDQGECLTGGELS